MALNPSCRALIVQSSNGDVDTIKTTDFHQFWSETEQAWVQACDLAVGDKLRGLNYQLLRVVDSTPIPGRHTVYNLTVEMDHVYRVGQLAVLVHNNGCNWVYHGTDEASANSINTNGLNEADWHAAAGGYGVDPKGLSVTTDPEIAQKWADFRALERNSTPVVLRADGSQLPLMKGSPGEWTDPSEFYIRPEDFPFVSPGTFSRP